LVLSQTLDLVSGLRVTIKLVKASEVVNWKR